MGLFRRSGVITMLEVTPMPNAFPNIESTHGVCGGEPCITGTRIPVWLLEQARRLGKSQSEVLRAYPTLRREEVLLAWAYAKAHKNEIDLQIRENEEAG